MESAAVAAAKPLDTGYCQQQHPQPTDAVKPSVQGKSMLVAMLMRACK